MIFLSWGLGKTDLDYLEKTFRKYPSIHEVVIFGSRALGHYKPGSDLDLALKGVNIHQVIAEVWGLISDESPLPFKVDLVDYHQIQNQNLKSHIDQYGQILYQKN